MSNKEGKLLFVVPLVSAERAASWKQVQKFFERTLRSICAQTSPNFQVVVACHDLPGIEFDHPAVHYLQVDHPLPSTDRHSRVLDKKIKIRLALHRGRELGATHSMCVDADDCVSRRLAAFVAERPEADGWFLDKGYFYSEKSGALHLRRGDFHCWTGTAHIVKKGIFEMPEQLRAADLEDQSLLSATYYDRHSKALAELAVRGAHLRPLPFAGAIYVIEHGSNLGTISESMYRIDGPLHRLKRAIFNKRRVTDRIRREYGFYENPG